MESIKNIAARHKMSEGAIKQNLLRNKRKLKKICINLSYIYFYLLKFYSLNWFEKEKSKFCKVDFTKPEKQKESCQTAEEKTERTKKTD